MLCENIKRLRKSKGLSQGELADRLHVVRQTVSKWEKGLSVPDSEMLVRIADALDTPVNELLGEIVPEKMSDEELRELARKLQILNENYAGLIERRRRIWRIVFVVAIVIALVWLIGVAGVALLPSISGAEIRGEDIAIIGGADGPTAIFVAGVTPMDFVAPVLILIVAIAGICRMRRKH